VTRYLALAFGLLLAAIQPAPAATIEAKGDTIEIKGMIELGDFDKFTVKLGRFPDSKTVSLNSPGGRARDAFQIGRLLRIWEMGTVVPAGQTCGSSCVLIWAAGIWRELGPGANLYMHCVFAAKHIKNAKDIKNTDLKTAKCAESANENLMRYLTHMGMPKEAIDILANSKPTDSILVRRNMDGLIKPRPKST
jgi:hypothetical protein